MSRQSYLESIAPIIGRDGVVDILASSERDARIILTRLASLSGKSESHDTRSEFHALKGIALNLGLDRTAAAIAANAGAIGAHPSSLIRGLTELFNEELAEVRTRLLG